MTIAPATLLSQLQRAQLLHQQGQTGEAWAMLGPLRVAVDSDGQALRLFALVAQAAGQTDEAVSALKRIAAIEGDPPAILGAIADCYGQAGRHAEAYDHWGALLARDPRLADAHLNRAVAAANAGLNEEALAAADAGLTRFPKDARLLAARAMTLKNLNRVADSLAAFEVAVAADPGRALTRHNQAVALRSAFRFEDACDAFGEAQRLGMQGAQFNANWAAAALEANRVDEAERLYGQALAADPGHAEARRGLTRLKIEYRGGDRAFAHYEESARQRPGDARAWLEWIEALIANRRTAEALDAAERGLAANPASGELRAASSYARGMTGDAATALAELDSLIGGQGSPVETLIPEIALRAGRPERAAEILERRTARNPGDQVAWSLLSLAWRLLGDPREQWLCDYERLVMVAEVTPPDGALGSADYAREVAAILDPLHVTTAEPGDQTLRGGTQTSGSLFARPDPTIQRFRESVELAAARMIAQLPDDPSHPFLARKSERFKFSGSWSVRLKAGGHHVSHVHPEGWMSSAYYARLPARGDEASARREGWIQFGVPPEHLGLAPMAPRRVVEPHAGRLVLFPSYMWHGTIPFADGDRLTAAFDYLPL